MNKKNIKEELITWPQTLNTYLGNKGYTILKSELSIKHQLALKSMLMVKPYIPGSPVQLQKTFPAYRESDKKIYVPRRRQARAHARARAARACADSSAQQR